MRPRKLSNAEIADLPNDAHKWHNFSEDPKMYFVSFRIAWEVSKKLFNEIKDAGGLCIEFENKFIVAE